jgi:DNA-binding transcriptional LysR family regulator
MDVFHRLKLYGIGTVSDKLSNIFLSMANIGPVGSDPAIAAVGLIRRVVLWQPSFLAVGNVVSRTDLISTVPSRVAAHFVQELPIVAYDPPLALPAPDFAMYWHSRSQEDAGHKWLRAKIAVLLKP